MTPNMLIVDDDRKTRDLVSAFLTYHGYSTQSIDTNTEFTDVIRNLQHLIIIGDLDTLLSTSVDIFETALAASSDLVIITYGFSNASKQIPQHERLLFIPKPLNLDELESIVMRAREYQLLKSRTGAPLLFEEFPHILCSTII